MRQAMTTTEFALPVAPQVADTDVDETAEWIDAFYQVVAEEGPSAGARLLATLTGRARQAGVDLPIQLNTRYLNTIRVEEEEPYPGDRLIERRIKSLVRWNAMAMVHRQNKKDKGIGGDIACSSSLSPLLGGAFQPLFL